MVDITNKISSLRKAIATAEIVVSKKETIEAIQNKTVAKGDVFEFSRAAGLLALKKTSDMIPDCHPIPIEKAIITYEIVGLSIVIKVEVTTIYKTGVEVEAMHGASVVALVIYDMLKPIDKNIEISRIRLLEKGGGKSDYSFDLGISYDPASKSYTNFLSAVVVCSDSVSKGEKEDLAGKKVILLLEKFVNKVNYYTIIPDEENLIQETALNLSSKSYQLILFVGGTGLSPRDKTPDALEPLMDRKIPGIMEASRSFGQERTPFSMLSRGIAGFINETLVLTLPGSTKGAEESMQALFPYLLHIFKVARGERHD